jgi:hypothetical protein
MSYFRKEDFVFEWERSVNKENYIDYDASSMPAKCDPLDDLVSELFIECKISGLINTSGVKTRQNAEVRLKKDLRSLLWHLYRAQRFSSDSYVRISLSTHAFKHDPRRNPFGISREMAKIINLLDAAKMVSRFVGFNDSKTGNSRYTRVRANLDLLDQLQRLPIRLSGVYVEKPSIEFRDGDTKERRVVNRPFNLAKFDEVEGLLRRQNHLLSARSIAVGSIDREFLQWRDKKGKIHTTDLTSKSMTAIFHVYADQSFNYGRMHGGFWQYMPKKFRRKIVIDGMPTIELDYSAQILNMAASVSEIQIVGDPYAVDLGLGSFGQEIQRDIVKTCVVILINSDSTESAITAIRYKVRKKKSLAGFGLKMTNLTIQSFIDEILRVHPFLRKYAFKGLGKVFFFHDSEIARMIMKTFIDLNKVVLPIHDGFVVAEEDRQLLDQTMASAWFEKFGTQIGIKLE